MTTVGQTPPRRSKRKMNPTRGFAPVTCLAVKPLSQKNFRSIRRDRPEIWGIMTIGIGPVGYVAGWGFTNGMDAAFG
jgi:hypothetical protein